MASLSFLSFSSLSFLSFSSLSLSILSFSSLSFLFLSWASRINLSRLSFTLTAMSSIFPPKSASSLTISSLQSWKSLEQLLNTPCISIASTPSSLSKSFQTFSKQAFKLSCNFNLACSSFSMIPSSSTLLAVKIFPKVPSASTMTSTVWIILLNIFGRVLSWLPSTSDSRSWSSIFSWDAACSPTKSVSCSESSAILLSAILVTVSWQRTKNLSSSSLVTLLFARVFSKIDSESAAATFFALPLQTPISSARPAKIAFSSSEFLSILPDRPLVTFSSTCEISFPCFTKSSLILSISLSLPSSMNCSCLFVNSTAALAISALRLSALATSLTLRDLTSSFQVRTVALNLSFRLPSRATKPLESSLSFALEGASSCMKSSFALLMIVSVGSVLALVDSKSPARGPLTGVLAVASSCASASLSSRAAFSAMAKISFAFAVEESIPSLTGARLAPTDLPSSSKCPLPFFMTSTCNFWHSSLTADMPSPDNSS